MTCDRYRPLLALLVGNDLDPREVPAVRRHLGDCAGCQAHWQSLQTSTGVLQTVAQRTIVPASVSIWFRLSKRLASRLAVAREDAPGWLTLGAFSAACAALLWLTVSTPIFDFDFREVQVADLEQASTPTASPFAGQYPSVQFANNAQPMIPVAIVPQGPEGSSGQSLISPQKLFGGPRSF